MASPALRYRPWPLVLLQYTWMLTGKAFCLPSQASALQVSQLCMLSPPEKPLKGLVDAIFQKLPPSGTEPLADDEAELAALLLGRQHLNAEVGRQGRTKQHLHGECVISQQIS